VEEFNLGGRKGSMREYCSWFNFKGTDQQNKVGNLSGGERNRLHLAKVDTVHASLRTASFRVEAGR
jgi:ATPase subunit of ABC transporter with duplicated ATPase domains